MVIENFDLFINLTKKNKNKPIISIIKFTWDSFVNCLIASLYLFEKYFTISETTARLTDNGNFFKISLSRKKSYKLN